MDPQRSSDPTPQIGPALVAAETVPAAQPGRVLQFPALSEPVAARNAAAAQRRWYLVLEFILLYVAGPVVVWLKLARGLNALEMLWLVCGFCLTLLLTDPTFDRNQLWNAAPLRGQLAQILGLFGAAAAILTALVYAYAPQTLFWLPRHRPLMWTLILISYPLASVVPQTIVYRVFLFHRYRTLLRGERKRGAVLLIVASGLAFCFSHIVFRNWIAPALTLPGGLLFAMRYHKTRSGYVSALEHTLYGCFLFSVGLGLYFGMF